MPLVSRELARISETLNRGIGGLGTSRLAGEQQKTRGALLDYNLGRNKVEDARSAERYGLEKPGLQAASGIAEAVKQKGFAPASWNAEMPDAYTAAHFSKYIAPGIAKIYDAKWEQDEQGMSRLKKKDGSYVTNFDREARKQDEVGLFHSKYKIRSTYKDMLARWEEKKQNIETLGLPVAQADKEKNRLNANIAEASRIMNDPNEMIKRLEDQKQGLREMGVNAPKEFDRIDNEIKYERSKLMTPAQKLAEKRSAALHKETMALRKVQLETAKKAREKAKTLGGLTADQYLKWNALSKKDQVKIRQEGIKQYNEAYKNEMIGGLVENAPDREKYIKGYIAEALGEKKAEAFGEQSVSVNQKTGVVKIEYPDGKVEYYNQNKERVTEEGNQLVVGKIKR